MRNHNISLSIMYSYVGLPPHWTSVTPEDLEISRLRWDTIKEKLKNLPISPIALYVEGEVGVLAKLWLEDNNIMDFIGINFIEYMSDVFNNPPFSPKPFTFIYNVGLERALKTDFSTRVLKGLMKDAENNGCHIIIQGEMSATDFKRTYGINDINSVKLIKKPKDKII